MRKKFNFDKHTIRIKYIFFILACLTIILIIYSDGDKFNRENNVCLELSTTSYFFGITPDRIERFELTHENYDCKMVHEESGAITYDCNKCLKFRDKTYCELHPEDNNVCVCDEIERTPNNNWFETCCMEHESFSDVEKINKKHEQRFRYWEGDYYSCYEKDNKEVLIETFGEESFRWETCEDIPSMLDVCVRAHEKNVKEDMK